MIDLRKVQQAHRRFLSAHDAAVLAELNNAREYGINFVEARPGFKPRTGALQQATTGQVIRTRNRGIVRLQNRKKYAVAIDKGARPHVIRPRGRALRFVGRNGVVFARRVNHPGNKPYHFLSNATRAAGEHFARSLAARMTRIARSF